MRISFDITEVDILVQVVKLTTFKGEDAPKVAKLLLKLSSSLEKAGAEQQKALPPSMPVETVEGQ